MTVKESIELLKKLPPEARLRITDLGVGGNVDVISLEQTSKETVEVVGANE
jgi:hypothetical protein